MTEPRYTNERIFAGVNANRVTLPSEWQVLTRVALSGDRKRQEIRKEFSDSRAHIRDVCEELFTDWYLLS